MESGKNEETDTLFDVAASIADATKTLGEVTKTIDAKTTKTTKATRARTLADTANEVRREYQRYVVFHTAHKDAQAGTLALYTLLSYVYRDFNNAPLLLITAATARSGKSTVLKVANILTANAHWETDPTAAGLRNIIEAEGGTVLIDEADNIRMTPELRTLLNAGFDKGMKISRAGAKGSTTSYDPFGLKVVSGIMNQRLPIQGPTLDRSIVVKLRPKKQGEAAELFDLTEATRETEYLRTELYDWAANHQSYKGRYAKAASMPGKLDDRKRDAWRGMLTIADEIGWGKDARKWAVELADAMPVTEDENTQLLKDVYRVLREHEDNYISIGELADRRNKLDDAEYPGEIGALALGMRLRHMEVPTEKFYPAAGAKQVRGYRFRFDGGGWSGVWAEAADRFQLGEWYEDREGCLSRLSRLARGVSCVS